MDFSLSEINWVAVVVAFITGQIVLTLWFTVLFGEPWAKAYGAEDRAAHTKAVPGSAYGVGAVCMALLVLGTAILHQATGVSGLVGGATFGLVAALSFGIATVLPGYGFLLKSDAGRIAAGSQAVAIFFVSLVLGTFGT